jgi:hypothetical protein
VTPSFSGRALLCGVKVNATNHEKRFSFFGTYKLKEL